MILRVAIYQRRLGRGSLRWTSLGLGRRTVTATGASLPAARRHFIQELTAEAVQSTAAELARFTLHPGARLVQVKVALDLRSGRGRRTPSGRFPVVVEPRAIGGGRLFAIAYHPERQKDWFPAPLQDGLLDEVALAARATAAWSLAWRDLDDLAIADLIITRGARLRSIELSIHRRSKLAARLAQKGSLWADLEVSPHRPDPDAKGDETTRPAFDELPRLGLDMTVRAIDGALALGRPRSPYRERLNLLLGPARRTPVLLVGPAGVGKRTILRRWVADLAEAEGYRTDQNLDRLHHVWSIAGRRVIAGMQYLGDWEQRCVRILRDCAAHNGILWIEDVAAWGRIGQTRDSDRSLADFFRGPMERGEIVLVGACTPAELQRLEDDAPAFTGLFTTIHVAPAGPDATLEMLVHEARELERADPEVVFDPDVFRSVLDDGVPILPGAALPGAALDILRRACRERDEYYDVSPLTVVEVLARHTGLPEDAIAGRFYGEAPETALERQVVGQPAAVAAAGAVIRRARAGLTHPRRPFGSLLLCGPTGTGKTELAKAIATTLYSDQDRLVRLDLSELGGADAVHRLIGDRFEPNGSLTQPVIDQPFCVVLLDEIEKVHPSALNLLLQVLDDGRLTDAAGRTADFTRSVIVMTSNLGAAAASSLGFSAGADPRALEHAVVRAAEAFFPPELFNRIERIVTFHPLDRAAAERIAAMQVAALLRRPGLSEGRVHVTVTPAVVARVVAEGYDTALGARPLRRWVERHVGGPLADWLASHPSGGLRLITVDDGPDGPRLDPRPLDPAAPTGARAALADALDLTLADARLLIPAALRRLDALLTPEAREARSERIVSLLDARDAGAAAEHDQIIYYLDELRGQSRALRGRLGGMIQARALRHDELVGALAEATFLERAAARVEEVRHHDVIVELSRIGSAPRVYYGGLMGQLVKAYASGRASREGAWVGCGGWLDNGDVDDALWRADAVVLRLGGLDVADWLGGERGFHLWESSAYGPDLVCVDVRPAGPEDDDRRLAERARALSRPAGFPGTADMRLVRRIRYEWPDDPAVSQPAEVEDFALGLFCALPARRLDAALTQVLLLRAGREAAGVGPGEGA